MHRHHKAWTVLEATQESPTLARLAELVIDSASRLKSVEHLIPPLLRSGIKAGPVEGTVWCLVLDNNAIASKLRQLIPAMQSHLRIKGWDVTQIRLKIAMAGKGN